MTIVLTNDWHKQDMARAVPGSAWDHDAIDGGAWVLDNPTPRAAAVALKLFPSLNLTEPGLVAMRASLLSDLRPFDNATPYNSRIVAPRVQAVLDSIGWKLFEFQAIDLGYHHAILQEHGASYLGWERGMGKTLGTCCLLDSLDVRAGLVVCPNTAKQTVWGDELARFCPWLEVLILPNDKAKRNATLIEAQELHAAGTPFVLVAHYEALSIIAGKPTKPGSKALGNGWKKLGIQWGLKAFDEAHRLSNPNALMTRGASKIPAAACIMLSGSIIQNHLEELYGPLHIMFPDRYRSKWRDWNDRFLDYVENGWAKVCIGVKQDRITQLRSELGVFMTYRRKEDELDLPKKTIKTVYVDLSPSQRKAYDQLVEQCMTTLEDGTTIKAEVGVAMLTKLRQVASGLDLVSGEVVDSTKLDLAVDMIADDEDGDYVAFGWYKSSLHALDRRLRKQHIEPFLVDGDVPQQKRSEMIARFTAGEGRVFAGTLATLSESVNLQRANNAVFLDRSWNPGQNEQGEDRIYRVGQTRPVTITHIVARDTVDELEVMPSLSNKVALRAAILGAPKS